MADGKRKIKPDHDPIRAILSNISSRIESALPNSCACNANTMGLAPRSRSDLFYRLVLAFAGPHLSAHAWVLRHQRHQAGARGLLWAMKRRRRFDARRSAIGANPAVGLSHK